MITSTYVVQGMNCRHCVVGEVPGLTGVVVDLPTGRLDVTGQHALDAGTIRQAVEEAGFRLI
ncbi:MULTISPECIES: heavy metal-associated domain-containing protein [unclassified Nonomuraea]|uniref:heavy-metal-associated domain-containing protein n=1 Tax=unclassified Nonomuraea TaxID=2593643 RepID=UPI0033E96EC9